MKKDKTRHIPIHNPVYLAMGHHLASGLKEISYRSRIRRDAGKISFERDTDYCRKVRAYYRCYGLRGIDCYWHELFRKTSGIESVEYVPENLFYRFIEPHHNELELARAYADKSLYRDRFGDLVKTPRNIMWKGRGIYQNDKKENIGLRGAVDSLLSMQGRFVIKPSLISGGGRKVALLEIGKGRLSLNQDPVDPDELLGKYEEHFVIQELIHQDRRLDGFNPDSVNSVKVMTLRKDQEIVFLNAYLRFGRRGSVTDNVKSGGLMAGVNSHGELTGLAISGSFVKFEAHPDTGLAFRGPYPGFADIVKRALLLHERLPYFRFVTWDMVLDDEGEVVLIEVNLSQQDVRGYQLLGGPVFGAYTDWILRETFLG